MNARFTGTWILALTLLIAVETRAERRVPLYLFYLEGCSACIEEKRFLKDLGQRVPELEVRAFEAVSSEANGRLLASAAAIFGLQATVLPVTFIGTAEPIVGYRGDTSTGALIEARVRRCVELGCDDPIAALLAGDDAGRRRIATDPDGRMDSDVTTVELPLMGTTDLSRLPLVTLAIVLGGLDSFNPCAFFVLFTLLGIIVHARSRRRMLFIGGTFVAFSALVYFVFMAAWLNLFLYVGELRAVTAAAGIVALIIATINVKDYFFFKRGVSLTIPDSKKPKLFERMRRLLHESSAPALVFGTVVLAVAANTYELLCTAGFPMVFTRILTLNELSPAEHYLYLGVYNLVYIIPLAVVVGVFTFTLGARKLTEEQGRVMKLVSGFMMLGMGLVVLTAPSLFNNMLAGLGLLATTLLATMAVVAFERALKARGGVGRTGEAGGVAKSG